ncbi:hypothetical protein RFI_30687 [Reticulomyxa filosa]|uniref:Uncharacterized protein n=1 Tax=Reticulomyxa filosa TaxID=46433 RepID=X6M144_RETFI|nr:hypothetical protein RFI_30687 [Reticulomyxa filosa]|eukprot:ETO06705.1 hypothetical protein RFI_30687 [Reticulomyxa filosa]
MGTVPLETPHPKNGEFIQPYLVAYFKSNGSNIDKNKTWLEKYIKNATILRDDDSDKSMMHLYCSNKSSPREGDVSSIVKHWPYRPIQTDADNCYMRNHNVGYRIRLGDDIYRWLCNQERRSLVFNETDYKTVINEEKMEQALVAKVNIHTIQNGAFYHRDESTNQTYFQLYLTLTERNQFYRFYKSNLLKFVSEFDEKFLSFAQLTFSQKKNFKTNFSLVFKNYMSSFNMFNVKFLFVYPKLCFKISLFYDIFPTGEKGLMIALSLSSIFELNICLFFKVF